MVVVSEEQLGREILARGQELSRSPKSPGSFCPKAHTASQNTEMPGLQPREGLFERQPRKETERTNLRSASEKARDSGIYGIMNIEAGWPDAWGARGKVIGKRCTDCSSGQV